MRALSVPPSPALAPFVEVLWWFEGDALAHRRERVLPGTTMQLVVNLHDDALRWWEGPRLDVAKHGVGAAVSGIYDRAFAIDTASQRRVVGAVLRPGAAPALLGCDADVLAGQHIALDELWPRRGAPLREQLLEASTPHAVLARFDAWLRARVVAPIDPSVSRACDRLAAEMPVAGVAAELGWSSKRLRQRFVAAVGVTPKRFARLARLQRLLSTAAQGNHRGWADLAVACGYYDQAHMVAEFRALTGLTPSAYAPRDDDDLRHVVLPH